MTTNADLSKRVRDVASVCEPGSVMGVTLTAAADALDQAEARVRELDAVALERGEMLEAALCEVENLKEKVSELEAAEAEDSAVIQQLEKRIALVDAERIDWVNRCTDAQTKVRELEAELGRVKASLKPYGEIKDHHLGASVGEVVALWKRWEASSTDYEGRWASLCDLLGWSYGADAESVLHEVSELKSGHTTAAADSSAELKTEPDSAVLARLRDAGWMVVCHNDYWLKGERYTFWSFARGREYLKGEGRSDREALEECEANLPDQPESPELMQPAAPAAPADDAKRRLAAVRSVKELLATYWLRRGHHRDGLEFAILHLGKALDDALPLTGAELAEKHGFEPHSPPVGQAAAPTPGEHLLGCWHVWNHDPATLWWKCRDCGVQRPRDGSAGR